MNTHSHANSMTTTIWLHVFIYGSVYAFIKICIVNNIKHHYILMSIPNKFQIKRYIAQVSKEKENIPKISIENVIKFQVYVMTKTV